MSSFILALAWLIAVGIALIVCAVMEYRTRVLFPWHRPELEHPRAEWGGGREIPPTSSFWARSLAQFARMARSQNRVEGHRAGLRMLGQLGVVLALTTGLGMIPFAGFWPMGPEPAAEPQVPVHALSVDLLVLAFLLMLLAASRVAIALSERSSFARLAGARQASRGIVALALLILILLPLAIDSGSLRFDEIVLDQQQPVAPIDWLLARSDLAFFHGLRNWPLPAWNLWTQPITAILFVFGIGLLLRGPASDYPAVGAGNAIGFGFDGDAIDLYWVRFDALASRVLAAALFVTLFLGGGSIPFVSLSDGLPSLMPLIGEAFARALVASLYAGVFLVKWLVILAMTARMGRVAAGSADDRAVRDMTRRLFPLAWANLLLVAGVALWFSTKTGGAS